MIDDKIQFIDEDEDPDLFWAPCTENQIIKKDSQKSEGTDDENIERKKAH